MSAASRELDVLHFPFEGLQVIEASAGTGKTWTLAMLYLRLLLGDGPTGQPLGPPDILVMTFTEAATQELRERIRRRIGEAVAVFRRLDPPPGKEHDRALRRLRDARPSEGWLRDAQQLEAAAQWMDEAAIHTIHGWSSRMLRQHAFDSVSLFEQERVEDPRALLEDVARDYWRRWFYAADREALAAVRNLPDTPEALLNAVRNGLALLDRSPSATLEDEGESPADWLARVRDWKQRFDAAERKAREAWRADIDRIEAMLADAMATNLKGNIYQADSRQEYLQTLRRWCDGATLDRKDIERFSQKKLNDSVKKGCMAPAHPAFGLLEALAGCGDAPAVDPLIRHATLELRKALSDRKARLAQFDFNDLLQRLYRALHDETRGPALAARLRKLYPVALVDEFQDTDPWQYGSLQRIYQDPHPTPAALVMIGDPKQAIYGFRGADLKTYLEARKQAAGLHTLTGNFRSSQGLVEAVNHIFGRAHAPFGEVPYESVTARKDVKPLAYPTGSTLPAVTLWHPRESEPLKAGKARSTIAESFATGIVALLADAVMQPADVAVLVRTGKEAHRIRTALGRRGVRSVYLSDRDSVYASEEAQDLWYMLRAVADPRATSMVRAALSTRCFGHQVEELDRLFADEVRFEQEAERFARWQQVWQQQGVLAMLYAVLHDQQIPARLLADPDRGERRLTNLLHLGDLLQTASLRLQGEAALVRFLSEQLRDRPQDESAAQVRLETDEGLVKVITMHKSKGLQYPVVFVPFAYDFRVATAKDIDPDDSLRLAEDRRLLYVAFTRAQRALFIGVAARHGDFTSSKKAGIQGPRSALSQLLGRVGPDDLLQRLQAWAECPHTQLAPLPPPDDSRRYEAPTLAAVPRSAEVPRRVHRSGWRSSSFTSLTRGLTPHLAEVLPTPGSEGEDRYADAQVDNAPGVEGGVSADAAPAVGRYQDFPGGAQIGDLLHGLLEWQIGAGWPIASEGPVDETDAAAWTATLQRRASLLGMDAAHQTMLHDWIRDLARCPLGASPSPGADPLPCLAGLVGASPEMGFVLPARGVKVAAVDRLLRAHIHTGHSRELLSAADLEGQLTGFLDLVFESGGRYYVLDYKSNKLPDYSPFRLVEAVLGSRYELQYTLYLLALHRLLKSRLPEYDYDCHIGGAIYVFMRGIDTKTRGIYRDCPPRALIETLDHLFRGEASA